RFRSKASPARSICSFSTPDATRRAPRDWPRSYSAPATSPAGTVPILKAALCLRIPGATFTSIDRRDSTVPMTSFHSARTARKADPALPVTSPAGRADFGGEARGQSGFTLLEIICVLAIIAILAAIALPAIPRGTSRPRIEGYALETAALLKADHHAAQIQRKEVATSVDAPARTIRSGASGRAVRLPADVKVEAALATPAHNRPAGATVRHFPSGMSCGGAIALTREGVGYQVRVNWLTGGVEVVPVN